MKKRSHVIAQKADGALRDALSIFDQIVSFSNNNVTYEAVLENLNVLDYDYYFNIIDNAVQGNIPGNLLIYSDILSKGFDGSQFILGLSEHLRNLLVCKDASTVELMEVPTEIKERYIEQSNAVDQPFLILSLDLLRDTDLHYKASKNKRLSVEICLMKLSSVQSTLKVKAVS